CAPKGDNYGYMLRHDAFDGEEESFCSWLDDFRNNRYLEPSYDQLGSLNNCFAFAWRMLTNPDITADPDFPNAHRQSIADLKAGMVERMTATHRYVAVNSRYNLRRCDGLTVDRGGGACWMYAYPLARAQGSVRGRGVDDYDRFLSTFI